MRENLFGSLARKKSFHSPTPQIHGETYKSDGRTVTIVPVFPLENPKPFAATVGNQLRAGVQLEENTDFSIPPTLEQATFAVENFGSQLENTLKAPVADTVPSIPVQSNVSSSNPE